MDDKPVFKEGEEGPHGIIIENTLNIENDKLPFGYYNPETEGKVTWICNYGSDGKIVGVFSCDAGDHQEKDVRYLDDMAQALFFRDELIKAGWRKIVPPKMNFTMTRNDGSASKELNRKQKRALEKKIKSISKTLQ
jgi:hypothetical protein